MKPRRDTAKKVRRATPFAVVAIGITLLAPGIAHGATGHVAVALEYSAEPNCPDVGYFKAIVVERFGAEAFADNAANRVLVQVTSQDKTFEGRMEWRDAAGNWAGERTFPSRSGDCEDLVRAMAFTLALQLQFSAVPVAPSPSAQGTATTDKTSQSPLSPPQTPSRPALSVDQREPPPKARRPQAPTPRTRPRLAVGVGAFLGFGVSASAVPFARVFGSIGWPHWSLELSTEVSAPMTVRRSDGAGFSHHQLLAGFAGCGTLTWWSLCALAKAGEIRIAGKDVDVPMSAVGPIVETGLGVKAVRQIFGLAYVSAHAEFLALPILWAVTLDRSVVWTSPRFAQTIGLDVAMHFE